MYIVRWIVTNFFVVVKTTTVFNFLKNISKNYRKLNFIFKILENVYLSYYNYHYTVKPFIMSSTIIQIHVYDRIINFIAIKKKKTMTEYKYYIIDVITD